jgi:hypothetical protein
MDTHQGGSKSLSKYRNALESKTVEDLRKICIRNSLKCTKKKNGKPVPLRREALINKILKLVSKKRHS